MSRPIVIGVSGYPGSLVSAVLFETAASRASEYFGGRRVKVLPLCTLDLKKADAILLRPVLKDTLPAASSVPVVTLSLPDNPSISHVDAIYNAIVSAAEQSLLAEQCTRPMVT